MLNRRILRVKAMQALYSYYTTRESLRDVVREQLTKQFYPDPAKDDFTEADVFAARRKSASDLFNTNLAARKITDAQNESDQDILNAVQIAISQYHTEMNQEVKNIKSLMLKDITDLNKLYFKLLSFILEIAHIEKREKEKREKAYITKVYNWNYHFISNPLVDALTKYESFTKEMINLKVSWADELDQLRSWYKEIIAKDEEIIKYQENKTPSAEEHKEAILHLFKKIIFKNESINEYFSSSDMHWVENKPVLKSLVVKTFQDFEPALDPPYELKEVSKNQEDDMDFFEKLFDETLRKNKELDEIIEKRIKNWDISRVALTDRILLKMAITEMMTFQSIPVKVSINEFIEVSKQYSTPKSKQFINGILDVLANELTSDGVIKKSGRGLIDNK